MPDSMRPIYGFSLRSTWLKGQGGREFVSALGGMGFGCLEVMPDSAEKAGFSVDELVDVIVGEGMIACFHAPYSAGMLLAEAEGGTQIREAQEAYLGILDAAGRAAEMQGFECNVNLHGASGPADPARVKDYHYKTWNMLRWACGIVEQRAVAVRLGIEMLPHSDERTRIGDSCDELVRLVRTIDSPRLGITWDMGHGWGTQRLRAVPETPGPDFLSRVIHTHIHDMDSEGRDHAPLIYGNVPLAEYIRLLKGFDYGGAWLLELDPARVLAVGEPLAVIGGSLARLRELVEG